MTRATHFFAILIVVFYTAFASAQTPHNHGFLWTPTEGLVDLGVPDGWTDSIALAISHSGHVAGYVVNQTQSHYNVVAAAWSPQHGWIPLKKGLSGIFSFATAVNDFQQIVGGTYTTGTTEHAFLWNPATGMQDLGTLGGDFSVAYGINQLGQVVGQSTTASGAFHAFLWTAAGGMQDLGALNVGADSASIAYAISDNGLIVGASIGRHGVNLATLWVNGQIHVLKHLGTVPNSTAFAINAAGQVVGAETPSMPIKDSDPFSWTLPGGVMKLKFLYGALSGSAAAVNASSQAAGWCVMYDGSNQAVLWQSDGTVQALGTLGGPDSTAQAINDAGTVVGYGDEFF